MSVRTAKLQRSPAVHRVGVGRHWVCMQGRYGAAGVALEQRRRSPILEIALLLAECVQHGLRAIAFCKTRKVCELVTAYTRDVLRETAPLLASRLAVYRCAHMHAIHPCAPYMQVALQRIITSSPNAHAFVRRVSMTHVATYPSRTVCAGSWPRRRYVQVGVFGGGAACDRGGVTQRGAVRGGRDKRARARH